MIGKQTPCMPCEERKQKILAAIQAVRNMKRKVLRQDPLPTRRPEEPEGGAPEGAWRPNLRVYSRDE